MIGAVRRVLQKDATWAAASGACRSLGRMAAMVLLARYAGVADVAIMTLLVSIEAIAVSALNALLASPQSVLAPGRRSRLRFALRQVSERLQCGAGLVLGLGIVAAGLFLGDARLVTLAFGAALISGSAYQAVRSSRITAFDARPVFAAEMMIALVGIGLPIASVLGGFDALLAYWFGVAGSQLLGFVLLRNACRVCVSARVGYILRRKLLQQGGKMFAGSVALSLGQRVQPALIGLVLGAGPLAVFGVANTVAAPVRMVSGLSRGVLLPRFALAERDGRRCLGGGLNRLRVAVFGGVCALVLVLAAPLAMPLVFGDLFGGHELLSGLLVLQACIAGVSSVLVSKAQAGGMSGACAVLRWLLGVATVAGMLVAMPLLGLLGVVAVMLIVEVSAVLGLLWMIGGADLRRLSKVTLRLGRVPSAGHCGLA